jgi:APA family basic amino acid/polyamine antiporter
MWQRACVRHRDADHVVAAARCARELHREQRDGRDQAAALGLFIAVGLRNIHPENYRPFAPNGFTGVHQGAAIVFFAYIGFDAISTAAEKHAIRSATCRSAFSAASPSARSSTWLSARAHGMVPYPATRGRRSARTGTAACGLLERRMGRRAWRRDSMAAVLLVFQYGQPRIFFSMARDGLLPAWARGWNQRTRVPLPTT